MPEVSYLFFFMTACYLLLSLSLKDKSYLLIFLSCECVQFLNAINDYQAYYMVLIMWSYMFTTLTKKRNIITCAIICLLSLTCAQDAYYFGEFGIYGTHKTWLYRNIEYIAFSAHIVFVGSFIDISKIRNRLRCIIDRISGVQAVSDYASRIMYNANKESAKQSR